MDKDKIVEVLKEKVNLPDELVAKVGELLSGKSFVGNANKDDIIGGLVEKLGIDEEKANEIYNAISEALAGGLMDKVKGLFGKK